LQRAYGLDVPQNLKEACDPRRLALVVYDMQVGVLSQIQGGGAVAANVAEVLRAAREAGIRVFFLRHMSLPKELMGVFQLRMAMAWQRVSGINAFIIVGVAMEIGIEPTVRHGADLGYIPIVVTDACGAGHPEAGERALASLRYMGDALFTDVAEIRGVLQQLGHRR
jgi:nicotinamidase-related amidase